MKSIKVVIADDQPTDRAGVQTLLSGREDIIVIGVVELSAQVLPVLEQTNPDVVILDMQWHGNRLTGSRLIREIKKEKPDVKIIAVSNYSELISEASASGADEAVAKTYDGEELAALIHGVCRQSLPPPQAGQPITISDVNEKPTQRELQILRLIALGHTDKSVGLELGISSNTVKHHITNIFVKLKVKSRAEAVSVAIKEKLIE